MSDSEEIQDDPMESSQSSSLPEDLPPVQPPSAGFIVQLFLVPGLIVLVIVGVLVLFVKLASNDQDWKKLLVRINSPNDNIRWRAALELAQMLRADEADDETDEKLSENPEIAQSICDLFHDQLETHSNNESDVKQQTFLARTLGFIDQPQIVIPTLQKAIALENDVDIDVRKNAIISLAVIVDRAKTGDDDELSPKMKKILAVPGLVDSLVVASGDSDSTVRQLTAYALGQIPSEDSKARLEVLIGDPDTHTKTNAALGLAQQKSKAGLPVFQDVLTVAAQATESYGDGNSLSTQKTAVTSYFWYGILLLMGLIIAGWGLLSDKKGMGSIAGVCGFAGVFLGVWGIYIVAQSDVDFQTETESSQKMVSGQDLDASKNERFRHEHGNNLAVLSSLQALAMLSGQLTETEKAHISPNLQTISEKHYLVQIRVEAKKTLELWSKR